MKVSGKIEIKDRVILRRGKGQEDLEISIFSIEEYINKQETIVKKTKEFLRDYTSRLVTLEGKLDGSLFSSIRIIPVPLLRSGTYKGYIESSTGTVYKVIFRVDPNLSIFSADLFQSEAYFCSIRSPYELVQNHFVSVDSRCIFDGQKESILAGKFYISPLDIDLIELSCILPHSIPEKLSGKLCFDSIFFRSLNIEFNKMKNIDWPEKFKIEEIIFDRVRDQVRAVDENNNVSIKSILDHAGIDTKVYFGDLSIQPLLSENETSHRGWDERELHDLMTQYYSRDVNVREWWINILLLDKFDPGRTFDENGNDNTIDSKILGTVIDQSAYGENDLLKKINNIFEDGNQGEIIDNSKPRQGIAIFNNPHKVLFRNTRFPNNSSRALLFTIVHEIGHCLNLPHSSLYRPHKHPTFMSYLSGTSFFDKFLYEFDPEEIFHVHHGFYNEVIPGGRFNYFEWSPSSIITSNLRQSLTNGRLKSFSISIKSLKHPNHLSEGNKYKFLEPIFIEINLNKTIPSTENLIPNIKPSFQEIQFFIKKPNNSIEIYKTPIIKCEKPSRDRKESHITSLSIGNKGFIFDVPGYYLITAVTFDPVSGEPIIAEPISILVDIPTRQDEDMASEICNKDCALYIYFQGGKQFSRAPKIFHEIINNDELKNHPIAAELNLVLALDILSPQKEVNLNSTSPINHSISANNTVSCEEGEFYLKQALRSTRHPKKIWDRISNNIKFCTRIKDQMNS